MAKYIFGIDLGTTYSCIAYVDESGRPVVVNNAEGSNTVNVKMKMDFSIKRNRM